MNNNLISENAQWIPICPKHFELTLLPDIITDPRIVCDLIFYFFRFRAWNGLAKVGQDQLDSRAQ